MLHSVTERQFFELLLEKGRYREDRADLAVPVIRSICMHWASRIPPTHVAILCYLVARTLSLGKAAQRISLAEFGEALSMHRNSARTHTSALMDDGFLHIYKTAGIAGSEREARMFEIDCNFVLQNDPEWAEHLALLGSEKGPTPVQELDTPVQNLYPPTYINYIDSSSSNSRDKSLLSARPSRTRSGKEDTLLPEPKKPRTAIVRPTSIAGVLATVQGKTATAQIARAASAAVKAAHHVDKLELQALLDKAMKTYAPTATRMVVTGKEFGFLRKRLKEAPPHNLEAFLNWVVSYWPTIAHQNRMAKQRRAEEADKRTASALPMAPDFASLCYRYPYFLKAFANHNAERSAGEAAARETTEVDRLKRTLKAKEQDIDVLRSELTRTKTVMRRTPTAPRIITTPRPVRADLPDADLPEWSSNVR